MRLVSTCSVSWSSETWPLFERKGASDQRLSRFHLHSVREGIGPPLRGPARRFRQLDRERRPGARATCDPDASARSSTATLTALMPTPRPDTSVTASAVENPSRKIRAKTSSSVIASTSGTVISPLLTAFADSAWRLMPRPSSVTTILRSDVSSGERQRDGSGLVLGAALLRGLDPMIEGRCGAGDSSSSGPRRRRSESASPRRISRSGPVFPAWWRAGRTNRRPARGPSGRVSSGSSGRNR